tara:strand:- start:3545 stop:3799 length:255 start_codon:yes stop_codon:yes gene_type:complete
VKKLIFTVREYLWWGSEILSDILYPYTDDKYDSNSEKVTINTQSILDDYMMSTNERVERLQSEMILVQKQLHKLQSELEQCMKN